MKYVGEMEIATCMDAKKGTEGSDGERSGQPYKDRQVKEGHGDHL